MPTNDWSLENTFTSLPETFYSFQEPVPVKQPALFFFNERLAEDLGLGFLKEQPEAAAAYFSGNQLPEGAKPLSQAYAGHQFGYFAKLGDGRAVLLGEQIAPSGKRWDIQLKGSGQTPYSRRGDGRATLHSMLREYLISEAMHHLGIATTRGLAVVSTGETVFRGRKEQGAVLARTAASHIRVGTFEYAQRFGSKEDLQALVDYSLQRHYPELAAADNPALALLKAVMAQQIDLIVDWMRVGFIHGVMNTDNMSIAGESIDYGPCAFMNIYNRQTVFSSIDRNARYAFGKQPAIAHWNLAVFAGTLLPLIAEEEQKAVALAQEVIEGYKAQFSEKWYNMLFAKLGILQPEAPDKTLVDELLALMETHEADYTQTFLALQQDKQLENALFQSEAFEDWRAQWEQARLRSSDKAASQAQMRRHNPRVIPRNHWVENALEAAVAGDRIIFEQLLEVLSKPYSSHPEELEFQQIPKAYDEQYQTFCGT